MTETKVIACMGFFLSTALALIAAVVGIGYYGRQ
jgi:hypothetical protein